MKVIVARRMRMLVVLLSAILVLLHTAPAAANARDKLRVAVASNFAPMARKLANQFEQQNDIELSIVASSSGTAFAQIVQGAPYDLFLSADAFRPEQLEQLGHIIQGSRATYARGLLALWAPNQQLPSVNVDALAEWLISQPRLAIANPYTAPYGTAATRVLATLGIEHQVKPTTVTGNNVFQAFQFVHTGNAAVGFVGYHLVQDEADVLILPTALYSPIEQQLVVLKRSKHVTEAMAFRTYLLSPNVQQQITHAGFAQGDS
ncbi:molybdate ABC transporter substrate-binding protein [Alteromonas sp. ASW11-36]|uniref:Molybdate ABC transporter substrate-binding protein n=1 Tax=Alteromonas arenosi TaxID=3055817 RepID=A0ABT7SY84_9ALTE|nr:molybdate ABC transporter substrate-binding protein [Alteromonas sp. ASW11-36]MDM7860492.1 molybdate ABC transporter substrate-binding protein [Alteromonas sp. ASW11-36]